MGIGARASLALVALLLVALMAAVATAQLRTPVLQFYTDCSVGTFGLVENVTQAPMGSGSPLCVQSNPQDENMAIVQFTASVDDNLFGDTAAYACGYCMEIVGIEADKVVLVQIVRIEPTVDMSTTAYQPTGAQRGEVDAFLPPAVWERLGFPRQGNWNTYTYLPLTYRLVACASPDTLDVGYTLDDDSGLLHFEFYDPPAAPLHYIELVDKTTDVKVHMDIEDGDGSKWVSTSQVSASQQYDVLLTSIQGGTLPIEVKVGSATFDDPSDYAHVGLDNFPRVSGCGTCCQPSVVQSEVNMYVKDLPDAENNATSGWDGIVDLTKYDIARLDSPNGAVQITPDQTGPVSFKFMLGGPLTLAGSGVFAGLDYDIAANVSIDRVSLTYADASIADGGASIKVNSSLGGAQAGSGTLRAPQVVRTAANFGVNGFFIFTAYPSNTAAAMQLTRLSLSVNQNALLSTCFDGRDVNGGKTTATCDNGSNNGGGGGGGGNNSRAGAIIGGVIAAVCCCCLVGCIAALVLLAVCGPAGFFAYSARKKRAERGDDPTSLEALPTVGDDEDGGGGGGSSGAAPSPQQRRFAEEVMEWQIPLKELQFGPKIGAGAAGLVYRGVWKRGGIPVALKVISDVPDGELAAVQQEATLIKRLDHTNILRLLGVAFRQQDVILVTPLMEKGSLDRIIHPSASSAASGAVAVDQRQMLKYLRDCARGMAYLHGLDPRIIHRDLKPGNVLVDKDGTALVADFGISRTAAATATMTTAGTPVYMAPELLQSLRYGTGADVFSFGIMMWEAMTGQRPWSGLLTGQAILRAIQGERPEIPASLDPRIAALISDSWAQDPDARPTFDQIVSRLDEIIG